MVRLYDTAYQMTDLLHGQMAERPDSSSVSKLRVSVCVCVCVCVCERERERERETAEEQSSFTLKGLSTQHWKLSLEFWSYIWKEQIT